MTSIRILHASDLHIAIADNRRSYLDAVHDAIKAVPSLRAKRVWTALRKISLASSYDSQVLEDLAELIVHNAKGVKSGVDQFPEKVAKEHNVIFLREKLDAIVLTGDLATTGLIEDLKRVRLFLTAGYDPDSPHRPKALGIINATLSAVDTSKTPIAYLPGNHDRYWFAKNIPTYLPGGTHFDTEVLNYAETPVQTTPVPPNGTNLQVFILTADFTLRRFRDARNRLRGGWIAQGKVYHGDTNPVLDQLVAKTEKLKQEQESGTCLCILWAVHFPPEFPKLKRPHKLIDGSLLLQEADRLGVNGILAGHTHYQQTYRNENIPQWCPVYCCGTTAQHEPQTSVRTPASASPTGNLFQILNITCDGGKVEIVPEEYEYGVTAGAKDMTQRHWRKK